MATSNVIPNLQRARPLVKGAFRNAFFHQPDPSAAAALSTSPQLIVLFTWVGAKERYAHKFVDSWSRRGFNVLHVTTPVMDLVKPKTGTEITAFRVMDFLADHDQYKVILHGLSVGGYLGQRVLMGLQEDKVILNRITHQIYDSFTQVAGFQTGVANAVNPKYKSIVNAAMKMYTRLADLSCLQATSDYIYNVPTPSPAFFMHSLADKIGDYKYIHDMLPYMARGSPVYTLLVPEEEKMGHVSLFRHMGEDTYMSSIVRFLRNHKFTAVKREILDEQNPNSEEARLCIKRTSEVPSITS